MAEKIEKTEASKFEAPTVGDDVNHVAPGSQKITKTKVVAVTGEGRLVTVEVPVKKKTRDGDVVETVEKTTVPYREKSRLAGNTWHFAALLLTALLALAMPARANIPTYHTASAYGNGGYLLTGPGGATVILPADPNSQIRIVTVSYSTDTNTSLNISSGTTAYTLLCTNPVNTWTTNVINSTNGLAAGGLLWLQHGGVVYTNSISTVGNTGTFTFTNGLGGTIISNTVAGGYGGNQGPVNTESTNVSYVITAAAGFGVLAAVGDELYLQGAISSMPLAPGTNWLNGDDIFSGSFGRPVEVTIPGSNLTNRLSLVSAHYDSASQP